MVFENDYPMKIKGLIDELKYVKDKSKDIEEELKREQRVSHQYQYNNSILIDQVRDLKSKLTKKLEFTSYNDKMNFSAVGSDSKAVLDDYEN